MSNSRNHLYEFGRFRLDAAKRLLLHDGEPVALPPKLFDTLLALVRNRDRVMDKDELMKEVWGEAMVEEGGLTRNISMLRKALGESLAEHRYVVTVPGRGYQFVAEVNEWQEDEPPLIVENHTIAQVVIEEDEPEDEAAPASPASIGLSGAVARAPVKSPRALPAPGRHFSITFRQAMVTGGVFVALAALVPLGLLFWRQPPASVG